jgi:hypothetical protein
MTTDTNSFERRTHDHTHDRTPATREARAGQTVLDLDGMIVGLRNPARDAAIPRISVSAFGENGRIALERRVLGCTDRSATHVSRDNEVAHHLRGLAHGDPRQDFVELLYFVTARLVLHNAPVLSENPELPALHPR